MEKGAEKILANHGCLYMKDDYRALFEELEVYYKHTDTSESSSLLTDVNCASLSEYAQKKLEYINGSCIAREFPEHQPNREWAGAVLDLLEDMKLGNYPTTK